MKNFNFKGCDIQIVNESKIVSDNQCVRFLSNYLSHYLAEEVMKGDFIYIPREVKNKTTLKILVKDDDGTIQIFINSELHIEITADGYHNTQLMCEQSTMIHGSFFNQLHSFDCSGKDIMSY